MGTAEVLLIWPMAKGRNCTLIANRTQWCAIREFHESCSRNGVSSVDNWNVSSHSSVLRTYGSIRQRPVADQNKARLSLKNRLTNFWEGTMTVVIPTKVLYRRPCSEDKRGSSSSSAIDWETIMLNFESGGEMRVGRESRLVIEGRGRAFNLIDGGLISSSAVLEFPQLFTTSRGDVSNFFPTVSENALTEWAMTRSFTS